MGKAKVKAYLQIRAKLERKNVLSFLQTQWMQEWFPTYSISRIGLFYFEWKGLDTKLTGRKKCTLAYVFLYLCSHFLEIKAI